LKYTCKLITVENKKRLSNSGEVIHYLQGREITTMSSKLKNIGMHQQEFELVKATTKLLPDLYCRSGQKKMIIIPPDHLVDSRVYPPYSL